MKLILCFINISSYELYLCIVETSLFEQYRFFTNIIFQIISVLISKNYFYQSQIKYV